MENCQQKFLRRTETADEKLMFALRDENKSSLSVEGKNYRSVSEFMLRKIYSAISETSER